MAHTHPVLRKWFFIFMLVLMVGTAGAGLAVGALLGYIDSLPNIGELENYNPPEDTLIYDRTGNLKLAEYSDKGERREVVHYEDIPPHVINAFLAIEDERYYNHFGVDLEGIGRAIKETLFRRRTQGASTITMQVARNVVLNNKRREISRKLKEVLTALQIERHFSKEQILEFYVNHIFFGQKCNGIQAAAKNYFGKDVKDLTIPEAAMIAGLPKAPSALAPSETNTDRARKRRNTVLDNMRKLGYIKSDEEVQRYKASPIELIKPADPKYEAPYFLDYVGKRMLEEDDSMQETSQLGQKGYTIVSTVDMNLQRICEEELSKGLREVEKKIEGQKEARFGVEANELGSVKRKQARLARIREVKSASILVSLQGYTAEVPLPEKLPYFNPQNIVKEGNLIDIYIQDIHGNKLEAYLADKTHVQGAAVLLDVHSGEILALVGGDDWDDPINNGQFNRAVTNGRQPGSCWKPLLYSSAFDLNDDSGKPRFTPCTVIDDSYEDFGGYAPKNYENQFYGDTALFEALVKSRNVPTVKLFMKIGAKRAVGLYHRFNIVDEPSSNWKLDPVPSMCLGTPDITPLELAGAYSVFANHGMGLRPTPVKRIFSTKNPSDSKAIKPGQKQVISAQAAYMVTRILQNVVTRGTGKTTLGKWIEEQTAKGRKLPEMACKTGTTNNCFVAWLSGFTPDLVLTIYIGYDQHRTMGPKMVGGGTVGPIWVPMMDRILQTRNDWKMKFDVPDGIVFRDICGVSGKLATDGCDEHAFQNAAFKEGSQPTSTCDYHGGGSSRKGDSSEQGDAESQYQPTENSSIGERGEPLNGAPTE